MDNIVVLTNLSTAAESARRYAAKLAGPLGARVVLLHVYQAPTLSTDTGQIMGSAMHYDKEQVTYALEAQAQEMAVPAVADVIEGAFATVLKTAIARYQPRLLVLGLTTTDSYFEALLANRALPLLRQGTVPVMLVPEAVTARAPRRVLAGVDGESFGVSAAVASVFQELLSAWHSSLTLACTVTPDSSTSRSEALSHVQRSGLLAADARIAFQQPLAHTPEAGLLQEANKQDADLLVLLARHRSFLGQLFHRSVTARVLRWVTQPVLLLPVADAVPETVRVETASANV